MNKCVSLCNNLNEESYVGSKYLKDKVIDGELSSKELVDLSPTQIYPDNWKYLIEKENNTTNQVWKSKQLLINLNVQDVKLENVLTISFKLEVQMSL